MQYLSMQGNNSVRDIARRCEISKSSVHRIKTELTKEKSTAKAKVKKCNSGRRRKLTDRDHRHLIRCMLKLRRLDPNFTIKKLVEYSGMSWQKASMRTFARHLHMEKYEYLQTRKKGLLSEKDRHRRLKKAKEWKRILKKRPEFWEKDVAFYLDGVSFIFKTNPLGEALKPRGRAWRKRSEGLQITTKGSKDLAGGKRIHFLVAISYGRGVVLVQEYEKMNGQYFAAFIRKELDACFRRFNGERLFVMDNDPSQRSATAKKALENIGAVLHSIPPRSPDLNPIENFFHMVKADLHNDAMHRNITKETLDEFRIRVRNKLFSFNDNLNYINKLISSMPRRLDAVIKGKGYRTKY